MKYQKKTEAKQNIKKRKINQNLFKTHEHYWWAGLAQSV
jgi:hypothetical protein